MAEVFRYLTPITYWLLVGIWTAILLFYFLHRRQLSELSGPLAILFLVLAVDAFRTLFESSFFGAWYTARVGLIPSEIYDFLVRPEIVFIPKAINLIVALVVVGLLLRRLIPAVIKEQEQQAAFINQLNRENAERREAERQLAERTDELERSNTELQQFAYSVSHDLKEPLRMVASYLQLLDRKYKDALDQEAHEYMDFAVDGAKRMDRLIEDLLDYSRVASHGTAFEPVDSGEALREALDNLRSPIKEFGAEVVTPDNLPCVMGDRSQVMRLFQNLIGNAIKYRHPDQPPRIEITGHMENGFARFSVQDNGIGIDPSQREAVFDVFRRLHDRESAVAGSGIGLAICRKILDRHGGRIWVDSAPGEGCRFQFTLPIDTDCAGKPS
ncbi:ATP-binding protein [Magnetospira sp. QH-2]|uniref:sensor histidine kinase n=1 Tax=Magnetospira sp. (strain QH-2) TaxID=1288970 RepID=UPI00130EC589|nr:ATP-binding protein [Magnetospira sp. QH-2]